MAGGDQSELPDDFDLETELRRVAKESFKKCLLDFNRRIEAHFTPGRMDMIARKYFDEPPVQVKTTEESGPSDDSAAGSLDRFKMIPARSMDEIDFENSVMELNLGVKEPGVQEGASPKKQAAAKNKASNAAQPQLPKAKESGPTSKSIPVVTDSAGPKNGTISFKSSAFSKSTSTKPPCQKSSPSGRAPPRRSSRGRPLSQPNRASRPQFPLQHSSATQFMVGNEWDEEKEEDEAERIAKYLETKKKVTLKFSKPVN